MAHRPSHLPSDLTGFPGGNEVLTPPAGPRRRPLSLAWIDEELIAETRRVWSKHLRRVVTEDEAVEMLVNVRAAAVAILAAAGEEFEV